MLPLIWAKEDVIRNAIVDTYVRLFLSQPPAEMDKKLEALYYAKNLTRYTQSLSLPPFTIVHLTQGSTATSLPRGHSAFAMGIISSLTCLSLRLTMDTNVGELTSLEELVALLARTKRIPKGVIDVLWDLFGTN